jgi:hypothetical protein
VKLSVRKRSWGAVHVRGGRVLRVAREHPVTTDTFDPREDVPIDTLPGYSRHEPRAFSKGEDWKTATKGSIAMEIVARKTDKIIGYAYLSGPTIALHRYVDDQTRAFYAGCFEPAIGWKIDLEPMSGKPFREVVAGMMRVKYGSAAIAHLVCDCDDMDTARALGDVIAKLWKHEPSETHPDRAARSWDQVTHLLGLIEIKRDKQVITIDFQPPAEKSPYAVQLFHHHLIESSPDLVRHDMWTL